MIAWGREKRQGTKVNYNETNLWEKSLKEPSENNVRRKKTTTSKNVKKIKSSNQRSKSNSRSVNRSSNRRSNSSRSSKTQKPIKRNVEYDSEEESESESSEDESENYSENSGYESNETDEDEEESSYDDESEEETSLLSMSHRRIKPVKFFEIQKKQKKIKRGRKPSKNKSKGQNKKVKSISKSKQSSQKKKRVIESYSESESEYEEEEEVVQEILGIRDTSNEQERTPQKDESGTATTTDDESQETEYYVKFKERSYQQCKWLTKQKLFQYTGGDKAWNLFNRRVKPKDISNMTPSLSIQNLLVTDETSINSDWYEIDRIIDDANDHNHREYLVKWKSQEYSESTWELEENIKDKNKIKEYEERLQHSNPKKFSSRYKRPSPDKFKELKEPPESKINTNLRDYQLDGLNWLRNCWYHKKNNILADEMGLGKTAQIVCLLNDLNLNEGLSGPYLVVAPKSTLSHWKLEFERWTDLNCIVFHGDKESRKMIINDEINYVNEDGELLENRVGFDVMVTNYEMMHSDKPAKIISSIQWRYLVVDEAHKLKNPKSAIVIRLKNLVFDHCTLLTGTPIQNDMSELWSLLNFIDPKHYNDLNAFMEKYGNMKDDTSQIQEIQKAIRPILLRRKKGDVEKEIKPKDETIIEVELTRSQKRLYKAFLSDNASQLLQKMTSNRYLPSLQNLMMQLRKVCNHPFLIVGAEKTIYNETKSKNANLQLSKKDIRFKSLIESSGKMILIDKLLPKLKQDNHKILIFSQMVKILDLLENYLIYKDYSYERLDGGVSESDRQQSIERFNNDPDRFIFLLSTKAGGIGINLTAADTVIIYDSDWNPQNDIQAEARCHRIGQTSLVKVYRLITRNTYESEMFIRASKKLALDHVVLDGGYLDDQKMSASAIEKILRHGAYAMFHDKEGDDAEIDKFCAADIDQILSSRTRRVQEDVVAGGGSVFSNVTFNATEEEDDADINNADYWSQVLPLNAAGKNDDQFFGQRKRKETLHLNLGQVRKMIQFITEKGYPPSLSENDNEVAHGVLHIAYSLSSIKNKRNAEIITFYLRGQRLLKNRKNSDDEENDDDSNSEDSDQENFDLEDPMKVYGGDIVYFVEERAEKIIKRVIFFYRLKECLFHIQGDNFKWPEVKPLWDSPIKEYALMIGLYRYGFSDVTQIFDDETLGLEHSKQLKKQQIESRVDQIITKIENQFKQNGEIPTENAKEEEDEEDEDLPLFEIPDKFEPMEPFEWGKEHSHIFMKNLLSDKEINAIIQVVLEFGIPINYDQENSDNGDEYDIDSNKIIELSSSSLEGVSPDVVKSFIEKLLFVVNRIQDDDENENDDESENEDDNDNESENENSKQSSLSKSSKSEEIDLSDFPELQKLSATRIKNLKQSISIMSKVYQYIHSFVSHPDKAQYLSNVKSNIQFPSWWDIQCDQSMIDSFAKYGHNFVYSMLADQGYPFYSNLNEQQKEIVDKNASEEKERNKPNPFDEENLSDLKALFSRRSRVPRVLSFIKHINKRYERKSKSSKHHHSHSSSRKIKDENDKNSLIKNPDKKEKYLNREKLIGNTVEEVVYNLRNPQASTRLPYPADHYLGSRRLSSLKYPNAFGLDILISKRNLRIISFGQVRNEKQFQTKKGNYSLNPGFVSFRKYPVLTSPIFEQRWYVCEIIDLNDKPFFRITDIDSPEFTFTDDNIINLFTQFFAYLRQRFLPEYKKKNENSNATTSSADDLSEEEIMNIYKSLDKKDQKVAPINPSALKCYTIFGLNEQEDDEEGGASNKADEGASVENDNGNSSLSRIERSNSNLLDGLIPLQFDIPLFDASIFPQLKDLEKKE